jgi:hypothetical protein
MSIFRIVQADCPACNTPVSFELVFSVAADRRPDFRDAILDGSFQREHCPSCGTTFRADPEFSYMDIGRGQYIGVWPASKWPQWRECADRTRETFDEMLGVGAPPEAREIGDALVARVVFGWAALVEKILCRQAGIDDVTLEIAKALVMRNAAEIRLPGAQELRLVRLDGDAPVVAWVNLADGRPSDASRVPRQLIAEIEAAPEQWAALRERITDGLVVDLQREMLAD